MYTVALVDIGVPVIVVNTYVQQDTTLQEEIVVVQSAAAELTLQNRVDVHVHLVEQVIINQIVVHLDVLQ